VVAGMADRITVMYAGRPVEQGTVDDVFYTPRMPYTIGLLGSLPRVDGARERLTPIKGSPPSLINPPAGCPFGPRCPMHYAKCDEAEPALMEVDGDRHAAACYRVNELIATDVDAAEIFAADATDAELGVESSLGVGEGVQLNPEVADLLAEPTPAAPSPQPGQAAPTARGIDTGAGPTPEAPTREDGQR
jgi:oligopeptide/dipeptide ABC transporter ATP-binding protein